MHGHGIFTCGIQILTFLVKFFWWIYTKLSFFKELIHYNSIKWSIWSDSFQFKCSKLIWKINIFTPVYVWTHTIMCYKLTYLECYMLNVWSKDIFIGSFIAKKIWLHVSETTVLPDSILIKVDRCNWLKIVAFYRSKYRLYGRVWQDASAVGAGGGALWDRRVPAEKGL